MYAIIPARLASRRFPNKGLYQVHHKPLLYWLLKSIQDSALFDAVILTTPDAELVELGRSVSVEVCPTMGSFSSGTDRVAKAVQLLGLEAATVVNIQGDMPSIDLEGIQHLLTAMQTGTRGCYTLTRPCRSMEERQDTNRVKVVSDRHGRALYFSRQAIPYGGRLDQTWVHVGVYGFPNGSLQQYAGVPRASLSELEDLEQLNWLYDGLSIQVLESDWSVPALDHPSDCGVLTRWLEARNNRG